MDPQVGSCACGIILCETTIVTNVYNDLSLKQAETQLEPMPID